MQNNKIERKTMFLTEETFAKIFYDTMLRLGVSQITETIYVTIQNYIIFINNYLGVILYSNEKLILNENNIIGCQAILNIMLKSENYDVKQLSLKFILQTLQAQLISKTVSIDYLQNFYFKTIYEQLQAQYQNLLNDKNILILQQQVTFSSEVFKMLKTKISEKEGVSSNNQQICISAYDERNHKMVLKTELTILQKQTILELRERIARCFNITNNNFQLISQGKFLVNYDMSIEQYKIENKSVIILVNDEDQQYYKNTHEKIKQMISELEIMFGNLSRDTIKQILILSNYDFNQAIDNLLQLQIVEPFQQQKINDIENQEIQYCYMRQMQIISFFSQQNTLYKLIFKLSNIENTDLQNKINSLLLYLPINTSLLQSICGQQQISDSMNKGFSFNLPKMLLKQRNKDIFKLNLLFNYLIQKCECSDDQIVNQYTLIQAIIQGDILLNIITFLMQATNNTFSNNFLYRSNFKKLFLLLFKICNFFYFFYCSIEYQIKNTFGTNFHCNIDFTLNKIYKQMLIPAHKQFHNIKGIDNENKDSVFFSNQIQEYKQIYEIQQQAYSSFTENNKIDIIVSLRNIFKINDFRVLLQKILMQTTPDFIKIEQKEFQNLFGFFIFYNYLIKKDGISLPDSFFIQLIQLIDQQQYIMEHDKMCIFYQLLLVLNQQKLYQHNDNTTSLLSHYIEQIYDDYYGSYEFLVIVATIISKSLDQEKEIKQSENKNTLMLLQEYICQKIVYQDYMGQCPSIFFQGYISIINVITKGIRGKNDMDKNIYDVLQQLILNIFDIQIQERNKEGQQWLADNKFICLQFISSIADIGVSFFVDVIHKLCQFYIQSEKNDIKPFMELRKSQQFAGLYNNGNTCYLNSILQQLYMITNFRQMIYNSYQTEKENNKQKNDLLNEVFFLFSKMQISTLSVLNTKEFMKTFTFFDQYQQGISQQQDAGEFYHILINQLRPSLKTDTSDFFFEGTLSSIITSMDPQCQFERYQEEKFTSITLNITKNMTLEQSLKEYTKMEVLENENSIYIEELDKKIKAIRFYKIKQLPKCLIFILNRFKYDQKRKMKVKINDFFEFPTELKMEPFTTQEEQKKDNNNNLFCLQGVVTHQGVSDSGHYISYIKHGSDWFEFNDSNVNRIISLRVDQEECRKQGMVRVQKNEPNFWHE